MEKARDDSSIEFGKKIKNKKEFIRDVQKNNKKVQFITLIDIFPLMNADSLLGKSCELGTLVSNSSFCESAQCLCNCNGLFYQFDLTDDEKLYSVEKLEFVHDKNKRSRNVGISSDSDIWEHDTRKHEFPSIGEENIDDAIL